MYLHSVWLVLTCQLLLIGIFSDVVGCGLQLSILVCHLVGDLWMTNSSQTHSKVPGLSESYIYIYIQSYIRGEVDVGQIA